jgi:hypothetical protein
VEVGNAALSDEAQLTYSTESGMAILTYNIRDFVPLAQTWFLSNREHAGIILSEQFNHNQFGELLRRVLRLLNRWTGDELRNQLLAMTEPLSRWVTRILQVTSTRHCQWGGGDVDMPHIAQPLVRLAATLDDEHRESPATVGPQGFARDS